MAMTPGDRIDQLSREICAKYGKHQPSAKDLDNVLPRAIVQFLNEEHAADQAAAEETRKARATTTVPGADT